MVRLVVVEPQEVARLAPEGAAELAQSWKAWINSAFAYFVEVGTMDTSQRGQGVPVRDAADVHEALDLRPNKLDRH